MWRLPPSRPGSSERSEGAKLIEELVLRPVESRAGGLVWRTEDGTVFTTQSLVAHCLEWFDQRMERAGNGEAEGAPPEAE